MIKTMILPTMVVLTFATIDAYAFQYDIFSASRVVTLKHPLSDDVDFTSSSGHWSAGVTTMGAEALHTSYLAPSGEYASYSIFGDMHATLSNDREGGGCCVSAKSEFKLTFQIYKTVRYTISAELDADVVANQYGTSSVFLRQDYGDEEIAFRHVIFDRGLSVFEQGILPPGQYFFLSRSFGFFTSSEPSDAFFAGATSFELTLRPVPLPPAATLLIGALGPLTMFRRRQLGGAT